MKRACFLLLLLVSISSIEISSSAKESDASLADPNVDSEQAKTPEDDLDTDTTQAASTEASADEGSETPSATAKIDPVQEGPFVDLLGEKLVSLQMIDETSARLVSNYTSDALRGKKVIGLYFSADWCGPCREFTPELVSFYERMNKRRGRRDQFEIVWISRCRDNDSHGQYFAQMSWLAMPFEQAAGRRGQELSTKYKVQGIPSLVLLDEVGNVITRDARNKIPADKAGIGFPWRNPIAQIYVTLVPKTLRLMVKSRVNALKGKVFGGLKKAIGMKNV